MVRTPEEIGDIYEAVYKLRIPAAKEGYAEELPGLANQIIAQKGSMKTAYSAALDSPQFDAAVREGLAVGKADVAYNERMDQIAETGLTESQKGHIGDEAVVRRHIAGQIASVINLFNRNSGDPVFIAGLGTGSKRSLVNTILMKRISDLSAASTAQDCLNIIKTEIPNFSEISAKA